MQHADNGRVPHNDPSSKKTPLQGPARNQLLELIAYGAPLQNVLELLCRMVQEEAGAGMLASVFPSDFSGRYLRGIVAPGLPLRFCEQIGELEIRPDGPTCVSAAYHHNIQIAEDIANDHRYRDFWDIFRACGLQSAWSAPIIGRNGTCLGSFALYYHQPKRPSDDEIELVKKAALIAAIAIENHRDMVLGRERQSAQDELVRQEKTARLYALAGALALQWPEREIRLEDQFCSLFAQALDVEAAGFWQQDPDAPQGWLKLAGMHGLTPDKGELLKSSCIVIQPGSLAERAYQAGHAKLVWANDADAVGATEHELMRALDQHTLFCCALHTSSSTYGLLYGASRLPITPTPAQIANAEAIAQVLLGGFERHDLQEQTRLQTAFLQCVLDHSLDLIVVYRDGVFVDVSRASESILGYAPHEMIGKPFLEFIHPDDLKRTYQDAMTARDDGTVVLNFRNRYCHKDGQTVWLEWNGRLIDAHTIMAVGRDITHQRRQEERQQILRDLSRQCGASTDVCELTAVLVQEACRLIGAEGGYAGLRTEQGFTCWHYCERGQLIDFRYTWPEGVGLPEWLYEHRTTYISNDAARDPHIVPELREIFGIYTALAAPLLASDGSFVGFVVLHNKQDHEPFTQDDAYALTEAAQVAATAIQHAQASERLRRTQEQLRRSERWYRALAENETSFVFVIGRDSQLKYTSPSVSQHLGYEPDSLVGKSIFDLVHPEDADHLRGRFQQRLDRQSVVGDSVTFRIRHVSGDFRWLEARGTNLLHDRDIEGLIVNARDVSHLRAAHQQLENAKRELETRVDRLTALHEIDLAITSSLDLRLVLNVVLDQTVQQLNADAATVMLVRPGTQELYCAASRGIRSVDVLKRTLRVGEGVLSPLALEQTPLHLNLTENGVDLQRPELVSRERFVDYYGLPLVAKGKLLGVLEVFSRSSLADDPDWVEFAAMLARQTAIAIEDAHLFRDLQRSNLELSLAYDRTIEGWARALDLRDEETEGHSQRVTEMTLRLVRALGFSEEQIVHVRRGALLHDIGKMGIPDRILLKPGKLSSDEWAVMQRHPTYAMELLSPIDFLRPALEIPYAHHEKWDGSGYPRGLKGREIPRAARAFAVVDVWDALRSDRPYRSGWPVERVVQYLKDESGRHFDPEIVPVLLRLLDEPA